MPYAHYPKTIENLLFAWVWPRPPRKRGFLGSPSFAKRNLAKAKLKAGEEVVAYHDATSFTRIFGSIACDQPLEVTVDFANDECDDEGNPVSDANIAKLHYDAQALKQAYDPDKQAATGKYFTMIFGRWLRVTVKNTGSKDAKLLRVFARGSVF